MLNDGNSLLFNTPRSWWSQGSLTSAVLPTLGLSDVVESWEPLLSELSQIVHVGKTGAAVELWSILASV